MTHLSLLICLETLFEKSIDPNKVSVLMFRRRAVMQCSICLFFYSSTVRERFIDEAMESLNNNFGKNSKFGEQRMNGLSAGTKS